MKRLTGVAGWIRLPRQKALHVNAKACIQAETHLKRNWENPI
ncbi:hypothetical protein [Achromobacter sp.]|nr:hypothetical protein [Achromobacter sp.]